MKFVTTKRDEIRVKLINTVKWFLPKPLYGIRVKQHTTLLTNSSQLRDRLNGAGLVIRSHHRNQDCVTLDGIL